MMEKNKEKQKALDLILQAVELLTQAEWLQIAGYVKQSYISNAAKVTLDGKEMDVLEHTLKRELFGEPYFSSTT